MRIHVLDGDENGIFRVIVHAPVPAGNNSAGVSWADAIKNSGRAVTALTVGNGAGQITSTEANQIAAGTLVEATASVAIYPGMTPQEIADRLNFEATQAVALLQASLSKQLKYFGAVVN